MQSNIQKRESERVSRTVAQIILWLLGLWLAIELLCRLVVEVLWFQEVDYLPAFWIRLATQLGLWTIAIFSIWFLLFNLNIADRNSHTLPPAPIRKPEINYFNLKVSSTADSTSWQLRLRWLLPLVILLALLIGLLSFHYGKIAFISWQPNFDLTKISSVIPPRFDPQTIWQNWQASEQWQWILLLIISLIIIIKPQVVLKAIAILISICFGIALSGQWIRILQYFHVVSFNRTDPLFGRDVSFYIFSLPVLELLQFWLVGLFLYGFMSVALTYLLSGKSLSEGRFIGFNRAQKQHLYALGSLMMLGISFSYWLSRYELLYSTHGVAYGASYTDVTAQLPIYSLLSLAALAIAILLLWRRVFLPRVNSKKKVEKINLFFYLFSSSLLIFSSLFLLSFLFPEIIQKLVVQPNEVARESRYIENNIQLTREAFQLNAIEVQTFKPEGNLTAEVLQRNDETIRNIRVWDTRPLLETNRQLQQIRPYYRFPSADIDRYNILTALPKTLEKRQVIIAARELDYEAVPEAAKTWVNKHLVYTHGFGFTVSPVNTVAPGGLPDYFVRDIGVTEKDDTLQTSSPLIRYTIPTNNPRIYYGEITNTYVMTNTKTKELDFPSGDENAYNIYDGFGGIKIGSWWRRLVFAKYLNDWQMLLTGNFTDKSKLLFRRDIEQRVRAIAPFLKYDSYPYLVTTINPEEPLTKNKKRTHLYWIIDAYTTSDHYPYSDPGKNEFNYIRNSVKVVVDAYNGDVNFYVAFPQDPIIQSLSAIFPTMFKPLSAMPGVLRTHIRYPIDIYSVQSERLLAYHMTDARVFYNREDLWKIPTEIYGGKPQSVEPYYLIMRLPTAREEEFILLMPFTPIGRTNLIAWLAGRSDGAEYGNLLLYQFPKQQLVFGPEQIEALINQDPVISQQISLWNRQGSKAIQGNLLVIPIEKSLLYVEPLYLEAEQNSVPTLARVIVVYENRIVMAETLEKSLNAIFQPKQSTPAPIVRPLEAVQP